MRIIDEMQMQKIATHPPHPPPPPQKKNAKKTKKTNKDRKEQGGTEAIVIGSELNDFVEHLS